MAVICLTCAGSRIKNFKFILFLFLVNCSHAENPLDAAEKKLNRMVQQCYEESDSYDRTGKDQRTLELRYEITAAGDVERSQVTHSEFKDANLLACVTGVVRKVKYPADSGPRTKLRLLTFSRDIN